jgi:hypothetical protein
MNPAHTPPLYFFKICFNIILLSTLSGFLTGTFCAFLVVPVSDTCPTHLVLDLIVLIIYLVKGRSTDYEASRYGIFASLLSLLPP